MKKYYITLAILSVCFALVAGVWFGIRMQKDQIQKEAAYSDSLGMMVAVVNQDLGVTVNSQLINYANAVMEALGSDYIVVSSAAAKNGMDEGNYGAIVTIPADFSANIVSINDVNPNQAMLDLAVNPELPKERYLSLYTQLVSMQQQVNNNIAYAYVETVYEQLHSAQDEIKELLANDETDMEAVKQVTLTNYAETLDLGDIPTVEFAPTSPDFAAFMESAQSIADNMNQVYVRSYADAQTDFSVVKGQIAGYESSITNQSAAWTADMGTWSNNVSAYAQDVLAYKETLDAWRGESINYRSEEEVYVDALNTYASDIDTYLADVSDDLENSRSELQTWRDDVTAALSGMTTDMDAAIADAEAISNKAQEVDAAVTAYNAQINNLAVWFTYLQNCRNHLIDPITYPEEPTYPAAELPSELTVLQITGDTAGLVSDMNSHFTALKTTVETPVSESPDVCEISPFLYEFSESMPELPDEVPNTTAETPSQDVPQQSQELTDSLNGIVSVSAAYNPDAYFDDQTKNEAQQSINQYAGYLSGVESDLKSNNASNTQLLDSAYRDLNSYVGTLRNNVFDVHSREQNTLSTSIDSLSATLNNTSALNHELMDSFVSRMPNSRIDSTVNQQVVENTVSPVTYSYNDIRSEDSGNKKDIGGLLFRILVILAVVTVLDFLLMCYMIRKQRKE